MEKRFFAAWTVNSELDIEAAFEYYRPEGASADPSTWFSDDEIREFINEYYHPARTEEEKEIARILKRINELEPHTLEYYIFPKAWEKNGLAELVRQNMGISTDNVNRATDLLDYAFPFV